MQKICFGQQSIQYFLETISQEKGIRVCITGDIAEQEKSISFLQQLADLFFLGNQDVCFFDSKKLCRIKTAAT